ncbi:MAG: error-prone DNA polymerase [Phenylobacterium sp.]|uniref:error-prone DNA polymerase n=1 Tax=Phenylobacterium sp. TaxID=1871053 RepID=UPI00273177D2|nr:error-prone DNA polymerase [Phenylobacterium sp.]MDP1615876.1 error-prone DNA polymerase [Phenylobacterium sp.]MDP3116285.1 error-prone DNA polymerase [Phenylobacterium sp.]
MSLTPSPAYAELMAASNFSFLKGASHPWELVATAEALGISAIGVCDRNSLAGVVRAWSAGRERNIRVLTGARLDFADGTPSLVCYPKDREAYGRLTRLLTLGQRRAKKGGCELFYEDFAAHAEGQVALVVPPERLHEAFAQALARTAGDFRGQVWLAAARGYGARDLPRLAHLQALSSASGAPMTAVNDVLYHGPERRPLQDVLTCIAEKTTIDQAGWRLAANAERHLKSPSEMARLFARFPEALAQSTAVAGLIDFDLSELRYEYPDEPVPPGKTPIAHLRDITWRGASQRYRRGVPDKVRRLLNHELDLIERLDYANYFLTVHDIVAWARAQGILCQGRGSAANSCVCFCLGVTAVDPTKPDQDLLFSRFISEERGEPPDIDVDFEHERREEVMQYVYGRYGRDRAAICATVIHYRPRMAIRQVGKALGLTEDVTAALAGTVWGSYGTGTPDDHVRQTGLDPDNPQIRRATTLATELIGFPRHLSQHVGGFILTKRRLDETVPIGNGAMKDRTFIEWDKDDIDALGLMKVDVLALGMLSALRKSLTMLRADHGQHLHDLADIPQEDPAVYEMLSRADSVGVFQVESRAQMSMLPRLKPRRFYDLVIEVAIVRPGPIQGDMVHPYLRRREGKDPVDFPAPHPDHGPADELKQVLGKTLGVPLFQEQAMRLAIEAAKFTDAEANGLRRAMATFRHHGNVGDYGVKFIEGMVARGYDPDFARRCFAQIEGFGSYGFPESHAISFALLVYASAWVKQRWPDVFCAALLNSQPMGFYQPAQLVRDARDHGVEVRGPDILASAWDCTLETPDAEGRLKAVRLGLRMIKGLNREEMDRLTAARAAGADTLPQLARQARLSQRSLELLAEADACRSLALDRRAALWLAKGLTGEGRVEDTAPLFARQGGLGATETQAALPLMSLPHQVAEDYRTTRLSLKAHPCGFFRRGLADRGAVPAAQLASLRHGAKVCVAGLVLVRQRPGTAKGVTFVTLEDETGGANLVIWKDAFEANRRLVMTSAFLLVHGRLQKAGEVIHVVAERFEDLTPQLSRLREDKAEIRAASNVTGRLIRSRDFH